MKFISGIEEKIPMDLLENRAITEGNVIASLWKEPDLYDDYNDLTSKDFITQDGQFYFGLGNLLHEKDYKEFDKTSVLSFVEGNAVFKKGLENRGGYETVSHMVNLISTNNTETYIDDLNKANTIIKLYREGFNITKEIECEAKGKVKVVKPLDLFKRMTNADITDWYEQRLMDIALSKTIGGVKIENLMIDDDFLNECDSGQLTGLSYNRAGVDVNGKTVFCSPLVSSHTMGLHKKNIEIFGAFSGDGKTSHMIRNRALPVIEQGENYCIISNEQVINEFKRMFLATIISCKLRVKDMPSGKILGGKWSPEEWEIVRAGQKYFNEHYKDKVQFVKLFDYSINTAKKIIKKLSKEGTKYFLYDTFKAEDMSVGGSGGTVWGNLIEDSKQLFQVASKEDCAITITMQLALHQSNTRYLTSNALSTAKGVKEIATTVILCRRPFSDEATGEKFDLKAFYYAKDATTGQYSKEKTPYELDKARINEYRIFFIDKTRNGEDRKTILYRFNGGTNAWQEVGYCSVENVVNSFGK